MNRDSGHKPHIVWFSHGVFSASPRKAIVLLLTHTVARGQRLSLNSKFSRQSAHLAMSYFRISQTALPTITIRRYILSFINIWLHLLSKTIGMTSALNLRWLDDVNYIVVVQLRACPKI